jgi:RNA polymerase sigma factor (sigma-70 family)
VLGVCRHLLSSDTDAEDAFQATFLAFVRGAKKVQKPQALASWLHGVAYRVSMKSRRTVARRLKREGIAALPEAANPVADATWFELQTAVHEEVYRLPETLRTPFVLCCLQGTPQQDAADQLGWKLGTLSGRLTKARQTLLDRLVRRGVPLTVAAGGAVLTEMTSVAVPLSLLKQTMSLSGSSAGVSSSIVNLAHGVTSMYLTRKKFALAAVVLGLLTTGIGSQFFSRAEAQQSGGSTAKTSSSLKSFWEYKLVPLDKTYTSKDFLTMLSEMEAKGSWEYCGTQPIADGDPKASVKTNMVFKRRISIVQNDAQQELYLRSIADAERAYAAAAALLNKKDAESARNAERDARLQAERALAASADLNAKLRDEAVAAEMRAKKEESLLRIKQVETELAVAQADMEQAVARCKIIGTRAKEAQATGDKSAKNLLNELLECEAQAKACQARVEATRRKLEELKQTLPTDTTPKTGGSSSSSGNSSGSGTTPKSGQNTGTSSSAGSMGPGSTSGTGTSGQYNRPSMGSGGSPSVPKSGMNPAMGSGNKAVPAEGSTDELQIIRLKYTSAPKLAAVLQNVAKEVKALKISVIADESTNSLIVNGSKDSLMMVFKLVEQLDIEAADARRP